MARLGPKAAQSAGASSSDGSKTLRKPLLESQESKWDCFVVGFSRMPRTAQPT